MTTQSRDQMPDIKEDVETVFLDLKRALDPVDHLSLCQVVHLYNVSRIVQCRNVRVVFFKSDHKKCAQTDRYGRDLNIVYEPEPDYSRECETYRPDFIQKDYLQNKIPSLWNHKNIPSPYQETLASQYLCGLHKTTSEDRLNSSVSTTSTHKPRSRCAILLFLVIGIVTLVGGAIAVAVYFTSIRNEQITPTTPTTTNKHDLPEKLIYKGHIPIDSTWDEELANKSSPKYQQKAENVSHMIDKVYQSSDLNDIYIGNIVNGFRKGSTEVIVDLTFKNPELNESSVIVGMNEGMIATTFVQVVQSGTVEEVKDFEIDTQKISLKQPTTTTTASTTTAPTVTTQQPTATTSASTTTTPTVTTQQPTTTTTASTTTTPTVTTQQPTTTTTASTTTKATVTTQQPTTTTYASTTTISTTTTPTITKQQSTTTTTTATTTANTPTNITTSSSVTSPTTSTTPAITTTTTQPTTSPLLSTETTVTTSGTTNSPSTTMQPANTATSGTTNSPSTTMQPANTTTSGTTNFPSDHHATCQYFTTTLLLISVEHDYKFELGGNVMVTFDIILKARYVIMQDGTTVMIDSSMVKKIVSLAVGVNQIDLHVIEISCYENYNASNGRIQSPNYPADYPNSITCHYLIQSPLMLPITLSFIDFEVEARSSGSCYDYVEIYDGSSSTDHRLAKYCGSSLPNPVTAFSAEMLIVFYTDGSVVMRGFNAMF
ncbi:CUBN [Mytilus edulis]|uniref:CUBN n=1 Tax=Mytilus edulis TaxID=6550 RepID=A0A8S3Q2U9_MYTED|nr:CUBN [Mytilus edulis]